MRRRDALAVLGAIAAARPFATSAQQTRPKLVAVLTQGGAYRIGFEGVRDLLEAEPPDGGLHLELREGGGDIDLLKAAARDFEQRGADVLVTFATTVTLAARDATLRVPIVFVAGSDPIRNGLVRNIARPGERLTGLASFRTEITPKRLALLKEMIPSLRRVITFSNSTLPFVGGLENARQAAGALGLELVVREVASVADIRKALDALTRTDADAFFFPNDAVVNSQSKAILERVTSLGMPTMAAYLGLVAEGALAGYGLDYRYEGKLAARYVLRILAGTPPSELPVEISERHVLGINMRTARALGVVIPPTLLARADEVIE